MRGSPLELTIACQSDEVRMAVEEQDNIRLFAWTELESIYALAIGVGRRVFIFSVRHGNEQRPAKVVNSKRITNYIVQYRALIREAIRAGISKR
jgi:predicted DNA-binding protein (UPF0251 family)